MSKIVKSRIFKPYIAFGRGIWIWLGLILVLAILSQINVRRSRHWVAHTLDVISTAHKIESALLSAQFNLADYLAQANAASLSSYQVNIEAAENGTNALLYQTSDNPLQQYNVEHLQQMLSDYARDQQQLIRRKAQTPNAVDVPNGLLQVSTQSIQRQVGVIKQEEEKLLALRRDSNDRNGAIASLIMIAGVSIAALLSWRSAKAQQRQLEVEQELHFTINSITLGQDFSSHLLTCRDFEEANKIIKSYLSHILPDCTAVLYKINNSRDLMSPSIVMGEGVRAFPCPPRECWALRRGEVQTGKQSSFKIPCSLCQTLHPEGIPDGLMCLPLQANEQTIGTINLRNVPKEHQEVCISFARQLALPLAVLHLQTELEYLSFQDGKTGIYNSRFLEEMLNRTMALAQREQYTNPDYTFAIIFIDVDHFTRFNSNYGHTVGDGVLRTLAMLLKEVTREGQDVSGRFGGEEFLIIMPSANADVAFKKAERIRNEIKQRPLPNGATVTISAGVATYPKDGSTIDRLVSAASLAATRAKDLGRDRVLVSGDLEPRIICDAGESTSIATNEQREANDDL